MTRALFAASGVLVLAGGAIHLNRYLAEYNDGTIGVLFLVNVILLTGYSLSCHSLRHLVGGRVDCFSCTRARRVRYTLWQRVTDLNRNHMWWAWTSLITVTAADLYVRLIALGVITDYAVYF